MEEILDIILGNLRNSNMQGIKTFVWGDPITHASFDLPAVAVAPSSDTRETYTMGRSGKDNMLVGVTVYVIMNARDGYASTRVESPVDRQLVRYADHVLGIVRQNITLDGTVATSEGASVQYVPGVRQKDLLRIANISLTYRLTRSRNGG